jgi:hypothetical protein
LDRELSASVETAARRFLPCSEAAGARQLVPLPREEQGVVVAWEPARRARGGGGLAAPVLAVAGLGAARANQEPGVRDEEA